MFLYCEDNNNFVNNEIIIDIFYFFFLRRSVDVGRGLDLGSESCEAAGYVAE